MACHLPSGYDTWQICIAMKKGIALACKWGEANWGIAIFKDWAIQEQGSTQVHLASKKVEQNRISSILT